MVVKRRLFAKQKNQKTHTVKTHPKNPFKFVSAGLCLLSSFLTYNAAANMWFDPTGTTLNAVAGTSSWEGNVWTTSATPVASPGAFADGAFTVFSVTGEAATSATVTVSGSHNFAGLFNGGLTGDTTCAALTISGAGSLNVAAGTQGINIASGSTTISCVLGGTGAIQPEGGGQLFLNGINTYSGGTMLLTGGVLVNFNNASSFGSSAITLGSSGGALICEGTAAINVPNPWNVTTATAGENLVGNVAGITWSGNWTLGVNTVTLGSGGNVANLNILSGVISGTGGFARTASQSPAGIIKLTGANIYSGKTSIQSGTTSVSSINSVSGGGPSSNLGAPTTVANGTISIGGTTVGGTLLDTGTGETTDR
ncbi:MAG: outer rane autotransporter barrel domain protein, partial [Pedosphaera sp.]|nr:outer rane autotransporter barrel domain protein [Pedosphaera sp.]